MQKIHPTALVDSKAQLADDVAVGPGCIIDGPVHIGRGTRLIANVYITGNVQIGEGNILYPNVCIGLEPQSRRWEPDAPSAGVSIGDRNHLREGVTIHRASQAEHPTTIGHDNFMMSNAHIGHDVHMHNQCTLASGAVIGGHAIIYDQVNIGGNGGIHQFCRVGRLAMVGGISAVTSDLPPFAMNSGINNVVALNVVGLRRSGTTGEGVDLVRWAFKVLYLDGHTRPVAVDYMLKRAEQGDPGSDLVREFAQFVASSERGITPHATTSVKHTIRR